MKTPLFIQMIQILQMKEIEKTPFRPSLQWAPAAWPERSPHTSPPWGSQPAMNDPLCKRAARWCKPGSGTPAGSCCRNHGVFFFLLDCPSHPALRETPSNPEVRGHESHQGRHVTSLCSEGRFAPALQTTPNAVAVSSLKLQHVSTQLC